MDKNLDIITYAVSLIIKAAIIAARFSGKVRKRSLKRLATMEADKKDKEILFLKDKLFQLETQNAILLKHVYFSFHKKLLLSKVVAFGVGIKPLTCHFFLARRQRRRVPEILTFLLWATRLTGPNLRACNRRS